MNQSFVTKRFVALTLLFAALSFVVTPPQGGPVMLAGEVAGAIVTAAIVLAILKAIWIAAWGLVDRVNSDEAAG